MDPIKVFIFFYIVNFIFQLVSMRLKYEREPAFNAPQGTISKITDIPEPPKVEIPQEEVLPKKPKMRIYYSPSMELAL